MCAHTCSFIVGSGALIGAFWNEEENKRTLFLLRPSALTCLTYTAVPDGCRVVTWHLKGNSISFSVFLLHFYLNYTGKVTQSDFEIEAILWFLILLLLPRENSSRAIVYFWKPPNFSTFFFTPKNMVLTENLRLKLRFFKWTLADSGSRILRELKWIIQFDLWSKGLITDDEKNKSSLFVISKKN